MKSNTNEEPNDIVYQTDELAIEVSYIIIGSPNGNIYSDLIDDIVNYIDPNNIKDVYLGFNVIPFNKVTDIVISVVQKEFDG